MLNNSFLIEKFFINFTNESTNYFWTLYDYLIYVFYKLYRSHSDDRNLSRRTFSSWTNLRPLNCEHGKGFIITTKWYGSDKHVCTYTREKTPQTLKPCTIHLTRVIYGTHDSEINREDPSLWHMYNDVKTTTPFTHKTSWSTLPLSYSFGRVPKKVWDGHRKGSRATHRNGDTRLVYD